MTTCGPSYARVKMLYDLGKLGEEAKRVKDKFTRSKEERGRKSGWGQRLVQRSFLMRLARGEGGGRKARVQKKTGGGRLLSGRGLNTDSRK